MEEMAGTLLFLGRLSKATDVPKEWAGADVVL